MHKLRHVFQRSQKSKTEENKRSQQFVKRHSANATVTLGRSTSYAGTTSRTSGIQDDGSSSNNDVDVKTPPFIDGVELSESERATYDSLWRDLDPFDFGRLSIQTIVKLLNECYLPNDKLEQILKLFKTASVRKQGIDKMQFFALLRLVAHAQNGREINQALVYLGAPITRWKDNTAMNALRRDPQAGRWLLDFYKPNQGLNLDTKEDRDVLDVIPNNTSVLQCEKHQQQDGRPRHRQSWWDSSNLKYCNGFIDSDGKKPPLQQSGNRRSYNGYFTTNSSIPNSIPYSEYFHSTTNTISATTTTSNSTPAPTAAAGSATDNNSSTLQTMDYFSAFAPSSNKSEYPHNRQSLPTTKCEQQEIMASILPDLYSAATDTDTVLTPTVINVEGDSSNPLTKKKLLLTQEFIYHSPSIPKRQVNKNNPFQIDTAHTQGSTNNVTAEDDLKSPFDDENNVIATAASIANSRPNSYLIPPPPVPSQATKPAFPKYTRRAANNVSVRRTQSTREATNSAGSGSLHPKHKSASNALDIFTFNTNYYNTTSTFNQPTTILS